MRSADTEAWGPLSRMKPWRSAKALAPSTLVARVERLLADLDRLKQTQPKAYARLSGEFRKRLPR